jgi:hypothetical protein
MRREEGREGVERVAGGAEDEEKREERKRGRKKGKRRSRRAQLAPIWVGGRTPTRQSGKKSDTDSFSRWFFSTPTALPPLEIGDTR